MARRVALITGAGSGIGRAVAMALSKRGYAPVLAGRRHEALCETADLLGGDVTPLAIAVDITDEQSVTGLFERIRTVHGRLDLLFNNAGINAPDVPLAELRTADWRRVTETNLTGTFLCLQAAFRLMKAQDPMGGRIINNGSVSAHKPRPNSAPYTASKHAITGLTKSASIEGRPYSITCSQIDIGNAQSDMAARMAQGVQQADGRITPEAVMDVAHVAEAICFMDSLPPQAEMPNLTLIASTMPYIGRG